MDDIYTPTDAEERLAERIDWLVDGLMQGQMLGMGICAIDKNGQTAYFYLNKSKDPVLGPALDGLNTLYAKANLFQGQSNAPSNNRSYRSH